MAALVYVYDHAARDLSKRLVQNFHGHHDLSLATLHVHLDDDSCMEVTALKGSSGEVRHFADHIIAERGVRYGRVVMIPTAAEKKSRQGNAPTSTTDTYLTPQARGEGEASHAAFAAVPHGNPARAMPP